MLGMDLCKLKLVHYLNFGLDHETLVSLGGALYESMGAPRIPLFGGVCTMLRSYWRRR
jgi:hypothetical protein